MDRAASADGRFMRGSASLEEVVTKVTKRDARRNIDREVGPETEEQKAEREKEEEALPKEEREKKEQER